ncbi:Gfo/Idh/MocA family oxidoreductase [Breoghania sp.]|uniref:Gfo/Idh/MocA family protein n=1 Tax=Breoghania sp. TaxID=2065378 RepID=UPI0029CAA44D|nr:Gfo/Idh/MocA family oxidoreductase [Breoghania sp.]
MGPSIGLAGFGRWGKLIFRDLRKLGAHVHVAVPSDASREEALAQGAVSVCARTQDLPALDGYVVAVPTVLHAEVLGMLAGREKPIFVEKPMTCDGTSARELSARHGEGIFVMDKWRYHPGIVALGEMVRNGELGEIRAINTYRLGWGNPHCDVDACWILMPHDLAIVLEILGHIPAARQAVAYGQAQACSEMTAILQDGEEGARVKIEVSALHPVSRRSVVVIGTKGSAQLADSYETALVLRDGAPGENAAQKRECPVGDAMPLLLELEAFLAHVRGGPPPKSSAAEGALVVQRIEELRALAGIE